jgi:bacteriorhodopsin
MIVTGLIAALHEAVGIKWGLYFVSNLFFVYVIYGLLITGRKAANIRSEAVGTVYVCSISFSTHCLNDN